MELWWKDLVVFFFEFLMRCFQLFGGFAWYQLMFGIKENVISGIHHDLFEALPAKPTDLWREGEIERLPTQKSSQNEDH